MTQDALPRAVLGSLLTEARLNLSRRPPFAPARAVSLPLSPNSTVRVGARANLFVCRTSPSHPFHPHLTSPSPARSLSYLFSLLCKRVCRSGCGRLHPPFRTMDGGPPTPRRSFLARFRQAVTPGSGRPKVFARTNSLRTLRPRRWTTSGGRPGGGGTDDGGRSEGGGRGRDGSGSGRGRGRGRGGGADVEEDCDEPFAGIKGEHTPTLAGARVLSAGTLGLGGSGGSDDTEPADGGSFRVTSGDGDVGAAAAAGATGVAAAGGGPTSDSAAVAGSDVPAVSPGLSRRGVVDLAAEYDAREATARAWREAEEAGVKVPPGPPPSSGGGGLGGGSGGFGGGSGGDDGTQAPTAADGIAVGGTTEAREMANSTKVADLIDVFERSGGVVSALGLSSEPGRGGAVTTGPMTSTSMANAPRKAAATGAAGRAAKGGAIERSPHSSIIEGADRGDASGDWPEGVADALPLRARATATTATSSADTVVSSVSMTRTASAAEAGGVDSAAVAAAGRELALGSTATHSSGSHASSAAGGAESAPNLSLSKRSAATGAADTPTSALETTTAATPAKESTTTPAGGCRESAGTSPAGSPRPSGAAAEPPPAVAASMPQLSFSRGSPATAERDRATPLSNTRRLLSARSTTGTGGAVGALPTRSFSRRGLFTSSRKTSAASAASAAAGDGINSSAVTASSSRRWLPRMPRA